MHIQQEYNYVVSLAIEGFDIELSDAQIKNNSLAKIFLLAEYKA
ncbi:MAG: hypothetical protein V7K32_08890 [Nostoc sp.]